MGAFAERGCPLGKRVLSAVGPSGATWRPRRRGSCRPEGRSAAAGSRVDPGHRTLAAVSQRPKKTGPLKDAEIKAALQHSGFPLEIRLLHAFDAAGFDPVIGHRFIPGEGEKSAEVDVMANALGTLANSQGDVLLRAMVEAKQFIERMAFVGFKWKQPDAHTMRSLRIRFSGRPTCQVLADARNQQDLVQLMLGPPGPIAAALDPLNEAVVCHHWAEVQDHEKFDFIAKQDDTHRDSFLKLVRVTTWLEEDTATMLTRTPGKPPLLRIQILSPTIVIATPHLYVYDSITGTLETTSSLILDQTHDAGGKVHRRFVDVVTEAGLPQFIDRYHRTLEGLRAACDKHLNDLSSIAHKQSRASEYEAIAEANRRLAQSASLDRRRVL